MRRHLFSSILSPYKQSQEKMYVCYSYHDYRKEFSTTMYKIFPKLSYAITYARSISDEDNDKGVRYLTYTHQGEHYDSMEKDSSYGRIAVDSVSAYFDKPDHDVNNVRSGT